MRIKEGLDWAIDYLREIENPRRNAEILLEETLNLERAKLYSRGEGFLPPEKSSLFRKLVRRRSGNFPLQYILGKSNFMGLEFAVDERTMIPRPETEILVEKVLQRVGEDFSREENPAITIIDLGTGCGNIAISLAKNIPCAQVYALDISREALRLACENARRHNLNGRILFREGDLFEPLAKGKVKADIVVSNPPYVAAGDFGKLPPEVGFEPRLALDGGKEGLDFYERIIPGVLPHLKKEGLLALEVGRDQYSRVCNLIRAKRKFSPPEIIKDYQGIERIVLARKSG